MNTNDIEIEAKFYLHQLQSLEQRLVEAGAERVQARIHETNLRFDLPDGSLARNRQVLRLRQDANNVVTFKGPAQLGAAVAIRQEIEVNVSDFEAMRRILEALGYRVVVMYEKWRTTYRLGDLEIVLDELPYGYFCEIEALNPAAIQAVMDSLDLDWEARIPDSYLGLFERFKANTGLQAADLSFSAFAGIEVRPKDLGVRYAD